MPRIYRSASAKDQIVTHYRRRIDAPEGSHEKLRDGTRVAPRREQVDRWGVAFGTINKAFAELIKLGYFETREGGGGGTFVVGPQRRKAKTKELATAAQK